jgi:biopolymer transport protein ExbD
VTDPREMTRYINQSKKLQGNPKDFRVIIRADRKVPYEFTQQAMAAVAEADVANVMFSTVENKDKDNP